jgi:hypothetical protein
MCPVLKTLRVKHSILPGGPKSLWALKERRSESLALVRLVSSYGVACKDISVDVSGTAIQAIPEIAKTVSHLTVFQRTPNWAIPLHNARISTEEMDDIRKSELAAYFRSYENYTDADYFRSRS